MSLAVRTSFNFADFGYGRCATVSEEDTRSAHQWDYAEWAKSWSMREPGSDYYWCRSVLSGQFFGLTAAGVQDALDSVQELVQTQHQQKL